MNRSRAPRTATHIDEVTRAVILDALARAGRTGADAARFFGISTPAMSRRLRGNKQNKENITYYQWTLGELVALSSWLGQDVLGQIAEESRKTGIRRAA